MSVMRRAADVRKRSRMIDTWLHSTMGWTGYQKLGEAMSSCILDMPKDTQIFEKCVPHLVAEQHTKGMLGCLW